jgi:hypothetical protein
MNKVKYSSYAAGFKLKVIEYAEKHCKRAAGRELTVSEFIVRDWRKQQDALLQPTNKSRKAFRGPKSVKLPKHEDEILEYVRDLRTNRVSHDMYFQSTRDSNKVGHQLFTI